MRRMNPAMLPLIVGAGPVGLGAALFLRKAGVATRIIDAAEEPSEHSKALAVNPRTLELLEASGVTKKMLAMGVRIRGVRLRLGTNQTGWFSLNSLKHKYPFMLALSQAATERLLTEALEAAGGKVERGTKLVGCSYIEGQVEAELQPAADGALETARCPWLLAADGAHSTVRTALNLKFDGNSFEKPWYLADVPVATPLEENLAHVFFPDEGGFVFLLRVVDPSIEKPGPKLWRVISNLPSALEHVPEAKLAGPPVWTSEFHISHRMNERMMVGNAYFAGDAAHIHSPMGARGMNLGLEDAWVFSQLVQSGRMESYERLRKDCDYRVVKRVEVLSRTILAESFAARLARRVFISSLATLPFIRNKFLTAVTGLDHSLDLDGQERPAAAEEEEHGVFNGRAHRHAH
jgi:2-polyprenyl-6-methoxyphenol hydroxylase-like FAD-dependent oxidoreductase